LWRRERKERSISLVVETQKKIQQHTPLVVVVVVETVNEAS
jgi:hypothetical protein